jgi:hypothetical protein
LKRAINSRIFQEEELCFLAAQHVLEMFRRALPNGTSRANLFD